MRNRFIGWMSALVFILVCLSGTFAEAGAQAQQRAGAGTARGEFNPRNLAGIWGRSGGDRSLSRNPPALTKEGEARFKANLPGRPRNADLPAAAKPELSNDPSFTCNPSGFPRLLIDTTIPDVEFIQSDERLLQVFQRERTVRELWTDGRELPKGEVLDNLGPAWYGHSVGVWEGNTLVVNTVGLDDRAWVDIYGYPKSLDARVEERYTMTDANTLEIRLTLFDPKYYTTPWVSDTKTFKREPREKVTYFGWYGLFSGLTDVICAPMNANAVNKQGG